MLRHGSFGSGGPGDGTRALISLGLGPVPPSQTSSSSSSTSSVTSANAMSYEDGDAEIRHCEILSPFGLFGRPVEKVKPYGLLKQQPTLKVGLAP